MEAAVEAARQLRLRDLAGLVVIDFIDMDEGKNNRAVEKVLKDALSSDRARIQMGRISPFGLMEISRQRRRLGVIEGATEACPHCQGTGRIRSAESAALMTLRAVDIEAGKNGAGVVVLKVCTAVGLYILNYKRAYLQALLERRGLNVIVQIDDSLGQGEHTIERTETNEDFVAPEIELPDLDDDFDADLYEDEDEDEDEEIVPDDEDDEDSLEREDTDDDEARERLDRHDGRGRNRRRRRGGRRDEETAEETPGLADLSDDEEDENGRRRRRGRRGGRRAREDGERDVYTWVRGRTPSLDDPYVWFDPLNPGRGDSRPERGERPERAERPEATLEAVEGLDAVAKDGAGEEGGRSRRRRRRGRGRNGDALAHEVKVENRATNEGMPPDGSPDTPMAVMIPSADEAETSAAPAIPAEPQRRRVRRKAAAAPEGADLASQTVDDPHVEALETAIEPNEKPTEGEPVTLDVTPQEAAVVEQAIAEARAPEPVVLAAPVAAPKPEIDVEALIAEDPNQIVAPPEKPKRGWWRR